MASCSSWDLVLTSSPNSMLGWPMMAIMEGVVTILLIVSVRVRTSVNDIWALSSLSVARRRANEELVRVFFYYIYNPMLTD